MNPYWIAVKAAVKKIPPWLWVALAALFVVLIYGRLQFNHGKDTVQKEWGESRAKGKVIVDQLKADQAKITTVTVTEYVDRLKIIREKGATIYEKIPVYIPRDTPDLPAGFRLLHDAGATNTVPASPFAFAGAPVEVATATRTITGNYLTCHETSARLVSLQDWVERQRSIYLEKCKQPGVDCSADS